MNRFSRCTHPDGALGVHCQECDPAVKIQEQASTIEELQSKLDRMRKQRDLAIFLGLRFAPDIFKGNTEPAKMFDMFQELRAKILKAEGYHPGWNCPETEKNADSTGIQ